MTTVLLTGFEPFGDDQANPSGTAVNLVVACWSGPGVLITEVLPVSFETSARRLRALIAEHEPDVAGGALH